LPVVVPGGAFHRRGLEVFAVGDVPELALPEGEDGTSEEPAAAVVVPVVGLASMLLVGAAVVDGAGWAADAGAPD
jgi:hypothetical protein